MFPSNCPIELYYLYMNYKNENRRNTYTLSIPEKQNRPKEKNPTLHSALTDYYSDHTFISGLCANKFVKI